ncbi:MAG: aldehyde dehydrogenase family protein [SAR324 cluster bacterium]|uniref:aldehyde dehydrogenase (NAD(+)) n=1 Tax=SAR324 cluster bacterium TaxID=2024889 RepID=A0A2A4T930_9DELT|nr:MAG: aldehyde dehydrogenase family protein [SAR324 cluster bacterium]
MEFLKKLGIQEVNPGCYSNQDYIFQGTGRHRLDSISPRDNQVIAAVLPCSEADYEQVICNAKESFQTWRKVPAPKRGEVIRQIGEALRENKDALGTLISIEMGKLKEEGDGEVQEMIDMADFAVGQSRMLYGKTMHSERENHRMYEQWHSLGIVGVITAFNFPVAVWAWNAFIAAIAGNVVIWKPSEKTPLCAIAVQNICDQVLSRNGYSGIFSTFIPPNKTLADHFIQDIRIPLISFTGSTKIGRHVAQVVSKRLGKTILELSGNNAIIVDKSADLNLAVPAITFGAVGTAGQRCTSTRRIIVHQELKEELIGRLVHAYRQVVIGDPLETGTLMGPLIDEGAVKTYKRILKTITAAGGSLRYGGKVLKSNGNFVEPTIVGIHKDSPVLQKETFVPILYILEYEHFEEALQINNNSSHGLSSAIFSNDLNHIEQFLSVAGSDCGLANVNVGTSGAEIGGAFGGEKDTGGGREAGSDAWKAYMRRQTTTINWGKSLPLSQGINFNLNLKA